MTTLAPDQVSRLEEKIDALTDQVSLLQMEAVESQRRRQQWDELRDDLAPVAEGLMARATDEFAALEIDTDAITHTLRTLLSNIEIIERLVTRLDTIEQLLSATGEIAPSAVEKLIEGLGQFQERGYLDFARGGVEVADRIVTSFDYEDIHALGDNVVLILNTVKEMTQPEVMHMLRRTATAARADAPKELGIFGMMREMRDPAVKRGMGRLVGLLHSLGETNENTTTTTNPLETKGE
ncbi:MAG: DUF1641 domain-containing protein [Acidimicrobiia bacterium]|nr:DUF1641 domain-containing protein [Acidimicrobiia bacterium]